MDRKVLLINPWLSLGIYKNTKLDGLVTQIPILSLASLSGMLTKEGHQVEILDLIISDSPQKDLYTKLARFLPDYVGITFSTPAYQEMKIIAKTVKDFNNSIILIGGGPHASALPEETLQDTLLDLIVIGEGEETLKEIINGNPWENIEGVCYKKNSKIIKNKPRRLIDNLDNLPFPAWEKFNLQKYKSSPITSKSFPVGPIETSRGCAFRCSFCNKNIFGHKVRAKSIIRVIDEIEFMLKNGFKEIHIWDENFAFYENRILEMCKEIEQRNLKFLWNIFFGVRTDSVDKEFFDAIAKAGCYSVAFGIESGNQEILDGVCKGIKLEQCKKVVKFAKEAGLETVCYFMLGLPGENEKTLKDTIKFAVELNPTYAKASITIPFPSTEMFLQIEQEGRIKSYDWSRYNLHNTSDVYQHENLTWEHIHRYYNQFYRKFYFRPSYVFTRFKKDILHGGLFFDLRHCTNFIASKFNNYTYAQNH